MPGPQVADPSTILTYQGKTPIIPDTAFIAPGAWVIGDVTLDEEVSIWFGCVLRGDDNAIRIERRTNVQDGTIIHVTEVDHPTIYRGPGHYWPRRAAAWGHAGRRLPDRHRFGDPRRCGCREPSDRCRRRGGSARQTSARRPVVEWQSGTISSRCPAGGAGFHPAERGPLLAGGRELSVIAGQPVTAGSTCRRR